MLYSLIQINWNRRGFSDRQAKLSSSTGRANFRACVTEAGTHRPIESGGPKAEALQGLHWSEQLRFAAAIELTSEQESELRRLVRSKRTSVRLAQPAHIVLLAAEGLQNKEIAEQIGIGRVQVARWRECYLEAGLPGIERDLPRSSPPVKVDVAKLVDLTTQTMPVAATHWSLRKMAEALGVSAPPFARHPIC